MIYFIRARTHYQYALKLWQELQEGKRKPDKALLGEIFLQGLKALYAITEISPSEKRLAQEEILIKILPTLREEEKRLILVLKEYLLLDDSEKWEAPLAEVSQFLENVKECLLPIL